MPPSQSESGNQSTSRGPGDPFELWRQIYETNERAWNAVLERTVNNPAFAESTGKVLETFLSAQKTVRESGSALAFDAGVRFKENRFANLGVLSHSTKSGAGVQVGAQIVPALRRPAFSIGQVQPRGAVR